MSRRGGLAGLFAMLLAVSSSSAGQESYSAVVGANTRFALKFFRQATADTPNNNVLIAPTALSLDFTLLQNGARPEAKAEVMDIFGFGNLSSEQINRQSASLREALSYRQPELPKGIKRGPLTETGERLILARSLWTPEPAFTPNFLAIARKFYGVSPTRLPSGEKAAVTAVNSWAAQQTGGKLSHILDSLEGDGFLFVNTTWFKGIWSSPFSRELTHPGNFTLVSHQKKSVSMMSDGRKFEYFRGPKFQAVRLNYWLAAMFVFLPDEDSSLAEFERSLSPDNWGQWMLEVGLHQGYLELPRFRSEYQGDVKGVLQHMGIRSSFTSFDSFALAVENPEGAKLTRVLQTMILDVDEKGTEIVSSGVIGGVPAGVSAGQPEVPFRMIVNRPFFFAILDSNSSAIVYMGAVVEP